MYVRILVDPQRIDLALLLLGSDGSELLKMESPYGVQEPISLFWTTKQSGTLDLEIRPADESSPQGHYKVEISDLRPATTRDEAAMQAQGLFAEGLALYRNGTAQAKQHALERFAQAKSLWQNAGNPQGEAQTLYQLGSLENDLGENQKAIEDLQRSSQLFDLAGDRLGTTAALCALGSVGNDVGDNVKALAYLNQALSSYRALEDRFGEAQALEYIGDVYENLSESTKALESLTAALDIRRAIHDRRGEAESLDDIGLVYYDLLSQNQKALEYYNQALPIQHMLHDLWGEALTLNNMGSAYDTMGEKARAIESFAKSLPLKRATGNLRGEGTTLSNMCWLEFTLDEWQNALDHCNAGLEIRHAVGDRQGQAITLSYLGSIYDALGDQQGALKYLDQALEEARAAGNRGWEGIILNNTGMVFFELGDYSRAIKYYDQARSVADVLVDHYLEATTLNNLGRVKSALGEIDAAVVSLTRAMQTAHDAGDLRRQAMILGNLGWLCASTGEKDKALDNFEKALSLQRSLRDRRGEASVLYGIARVDRNTNNLFAALTQIQSAIDIIELLRTKVISEKLRASYFASVREYYEFYIDLLMQLHQLHPTEGFDAKALIMNERSRARSLLESLGETRTEIRVGIDPKLLERELSLQKLLDGKSERQIRLLASKHTEQQAVAINNEIDELMAEYDSIEAEIREKSPRYAALTQAQPITLEEIQKNVLDQNTILLEYALGEQRSFVWAITPTSLNSYEIKKREDIETAAKDVYTLLQSRSKRNEAEYSKAVAHLSNLVLSPVAPLLVGKRLVIVGDGALQYVPFGIFPEPNRPPRDSEQASDEPLVVRHEIVTLPSASTLLALRSQEKGRKTPLKAVAVLADPVFDKDDPRVARLPAILMRGSSDSEDRVLEASRTSVALTRAANEVGFSNLRFGRLVFSRREAGSVLARVPSDQRMEALDFDASKSTATSNNLAQYGIVHFATHGLLNSQHPELSGLVLSLVNKDGTPQDGFLRLTNVYNLKLSADLVVLSACETALGKDVKGEGLLGLTRGFMYAGAPKVVASLWQVDDVATAELMGRFYKGMLQEGLQPAAALRQAQTDMLHQKRWSNAYYWAAFTIEGEWN